MNSGMGVIPPGGYKFWQRLPNGTFHQFVAKTEEELIKKIRDFRIDSNIDATTVEEEIRFQRSGLVTQPLKQDRSLRERVTGWKANRAYRKIKYVEPEVAEQRASICDSCPFNIKNFADDCLECYNSVERDLFTMRGGRKTSKDESLGACQITGQCNKTAAWLDSSLLEHRVNYRKDLKKEHPSCWLLGLDKEQSNKVE